jgi:hypothetical protein
LLLPETNELARVIHEDERIIGIVYGKYSQDDRKIAGRGALVSTNKRILLLDKKPMFDRCDEISYRVVSAVSYAKAGFAGTVVLHTRMGNVSIRTLNKACDEHFIKAIESKIFAKGDSDGYL